jgi:hypothetical protein
MAAAQDEETELAAIRDIKELQRVGSTETLDVIVQIDRKWPGYPQRYRIREGVSDLLSDRSAKRLVDIKDMSTGDPAALRSLLRWSQEWAPADHYMLVLWGHSYGLGFGRDHGDPLTLTELSKVLKAHGPQGKLDLLGANACAMSYAEAAYELRDSAKFLVASEITMPFVGWPYAEILNEIVANPEIEPIDLGKKIVKHFMRSFEKKEVALTVLDLSKADGLLELVSELANALAQGIRRDKARDQITNAFLDTAHGDVRPLIDLLDLCTKLQEVSDDDVKNDVKSKAAALQRFLESKAFIVDHDGDPGFEGLHGVGIFAPAVTGAIDLMRLELSETDYKDLELMKSEGNRWARFVYHDLRDLLDEVINEVADFVRGTGATTREDWTGVAQLLVSVKRSFKNLERIHADVEESVMEILRHPAHAAGQTQKNGAAWQAVDASASYLRLVELPKARKDGDKDQDAIEDSPPSVKRRRETLAQLFRQLESALALAESTAKKVTTHPRFGLGEPFKPGKLGEPFKPGRLGEPFKPGKLGEPFKPGKLGEPFKPGRLGEPFKPGRLGPLPWLRASDEGAAASETMSVAELFGYIAGRFYDLEETLAALETVALTDGTSDVEVTQHQLRATDEVQQMFSVFEEMLVSARDTAIAVLAHPTYGLGPGQPDLGGMSRQQFAAEAGLSPRYLRLLEKKRLLEN